MLRNDVFNWYRLTNNPKVTRIHDLTCKMLGSSTKPLLKTKAAETYGLLLFCSHVKGKHRIWFGDCADKLEGAVAALIEAMDVMHAHGTNMPVSGLQDTVN